MGFDQHYTMMVRISIVHSFYFCYFPGNARSIVIESYMTGPSALSEHEMDELCFVT